ncbi:MAG: phytoene/squalene synthase family protein [Oceanicaulis sp.]
MSDRFASPADLDACRRSIRGGSKSFYAASLLLPPAARMRAYALYGFCRRADDLVDRGGDPRAACDTLEARLEAVYAGRPGEDPVDRAFADLVRDCDLPQALPEALIEGFAWDAAGLRYDTISQLRAYAARVAGSVGAMMALVMGARGEAALARASDLGVAMQLTNIARDVGEDAKAGRLYLPRAWMREAGIDPEAWLAAPRFDARLGAVTQRLLDEAARLYARARPGVSLLPAACRPAIHAAARIYREIGLEAERAGFDTVGARVSTSTGRKVSLALAGFADAALAHGEADAPPLTETRFLMLAVPPGELEAQEPAWWNVSEHWGRLADILLELELRDRAAAMEGAGLSRGGSG